MTQIASPTTGLRSFLQVPAEISDEMVTRAMALLGPLVPVYAAGTAPVPEVMQLVHLCDGREALAPAFAFLFAASQPVVPRHLAYCVRRDALAAITRDPAHPLSAAVAQLRDPMFGRFSDEGVRVIADLRPAFCAAGVSIEAVFEVEPEVELPRDLVADLAVRRMIGEVAAQRFYLPAMAPASMLWVPELLATDTSWVWHAVDATHEDDAHCSSGVGHVPNGFMLARHAARRVLEQGGTAAEVVDALGLLAEVFPGRYNHA